MAKPGFPKLVISTSRSLVPEVRRYVGRVLGKLRLPYRIEVFESRKAVQSLDPDIVVTILVPAISVVVGEAVRLVASWLRSKRGRGHVKYKTIMVARAQAMHALEKEIGITNYELVEMRTIGSSYRIVFRGIDAPRRFHQFLVSRSCGEPSYRLLRRMPN